MKYVHYEWNGQRQLGIRLNEGILPLAVLEQQSGGTLQLPQTVEQLLNTTELHTQIEQWLEQAANISSEQFIQEQDVRWLPPVSQPGKVICIGLNYRKHAAETGMAEPQTPIVFSKFSDTVAAHLDIVPLPAFSQQVDYEAELCIVIGKKAEQVSQATALQYVFGYCASNDVSARDLQMQTSQWLLGKTCANFAPIGPYLVTADEVGDPNSLGIRAYVNDRIVQQSNTSDMIFHCDEIVHYVSQYMTLLPGDIILTGTPEGVILGQPPGEQQWLKDGDQVTIEIDKLGRLTNTFKAVAAK
ncbi:fumarylacetoacetate hydrolase family protein [Paenibacillus campi]|uniref:fumarylacetoacetate hydrolase family protein n=1 Tax=Paenibacillus campi TaxID=3106031 RepID=UPI002AFF725C|nr:MULTISPECIES: fumarylacetoacetate hydrolase family protein [unclassified Paenibacillus]